MMKFIELNPSLSGEWDKVAHQSNDAWLFHLYDWLLLTEKHWPLESKSFLVEYEGKIIGIFPLQLNKKSKSLRSTYLGHGGAALVDGLEQGVRKKTLKAMHEHARQIALESKSPYIEIGLSPLSESFLQERWQVNPLVNYGFKDISTHTWMLDLNLPQEELIAHYSDDARRSIKKATESGYLVEQVDSQKGIEGFYHVHCQNRARTGVETHPKDFFHDLYASLGKSGHAIFWQAKGPDGQAVAYEVTGFFNTKGFYWMGCSLGEHQNAGVNYLLQHHSIVWAKSKGASWFENGEAFPEAQEGKLKGLTMFKGKFGGQLHRLYKGRMDLSACYQEPLLKKIYRRLFNQAYRG